VVGLIKAACERHRVFPIEAIGILVVAVLKAIQGRIDGIARNSALIDDLAEAVQPSILVAGVAIGLSALFNIGQPNIDARCPKLRMCALHDGAQAHVQVLLDGSATIGNRRQPADGIVQACGATVIISQMTAAGIGYAEERALGGAIRLD